MRPHNDGNQEPWVYRDVRGCPFSCKEAWDHVEIVLHVQRKAYNAPMRKIKSIIVEGKRNRRRSRRLWEEQIKKNFHELHLSKDLTRDKGRWRRLIRVSDYW